MLSAPSPYRTIQAHKTETHNVIENDSGSSRVFLNLAGSTTARRTSGGVFHVAGPACENARSPKFVHSRGSVKSVDDADGIIIIIMSLV